MKKRITAVKPVDAQSDPFFTAVSAALLPALGITESTPYWCSPRERFCDGCGGCGARTALQKHQLALYHVLLAVSGVGLCFDYPEDDRVPFHTLPGATKGWRWPDAFLEGLFSCVGIGWRRFKEGEEAAFLTAAERSFSAGLPVLLRGGRTAFGEDTAWSLGLGLEKGRLTVTDFQAERAVKPSLARMASEGGLDFCEGIVFTGGGEGSHSYFEVLEGMVSVLDHPLRADFERAVFARIDGDAPDPDRRAEALCAMAGVPIEARWHTAEAFCSEANLLSAMTGDAKLKAAVKKLVFDRYIRDGSGETHGVCWKIWGLLDCGPETGYTPGPEAEKNLRDPAVRKKLKALWQRVFGNDRAVREGLWEILQTFGADR